MAAITNIQIADMMRKMIVDGTLAAGEKLPSRAALAAKLGTAVATLQRAMVILEDEGFLWSRPGLGTFVCEHGPHTVRYNLIFPHHEEASEWYTALVDAARALEGSSDFQFQTYWNITGHQDEPGYQQLCEDVLKHRVAGLLFFYMDVDKLYGSPILEEEGIQRVLEGHERGRTDLPLVHADWAAWIDEALEHLGEQGCRQPAALLAGVFSELLEERWHETGRQLKMTMHDHWVQSPIVEPAAISRCVRLLFDREDRPDGLVLYHESYEEGAMAGLVAAGLIPGVDVPIVVHANMPCKQPHSRGITRLGFDVESTLSTMLEIAQQQAGDEDWPDLTLLPPTKVAAQYPGKTRNHSHTTTARH